MHLIGFISDRSLLSEITSSLEREDIVYEIQMDKGQYQVFVSNSTDVERAKQIYLFAIGLGPSDKTRAEMSKAQSKTTIPIGSITGIFLVLSLCAFPLFLVESWRDYLEYFFIGSMGEPIFKEILEGELWRLITPVFLHFGFLHILFNSMWMKDLGSLLELGLGWWRYLCLLILSSIIPNILQYLIAGPRFGGLSGIVYALLGVVICMKKFDPSFPFDLPKRDLYLMGIWFFLCLFGLFGPIANLAHAGGLFLGVLWGVYYGSFKKKRDVLTGVGISVGALGVLFFTVLVEYVRYDGHFYFKVFSSS